MSEQPKDTNEKAGASSEAQDQQPAQDTTLACTSASAQATAQATAQDQHLAQAPPKEQSDQAVQLLKKRHKLLEDIEEDAKQAKEIRAQREKEDEERAQKAHEREQELERVADGLEQALKDNTDPVRNKLDELTPRNYANIVRMAHETTACIRSLVDQEKGLLHRGEQEKAIVDGFRAGIVKDFGNSLTDNDVEFLMNKIKPIWPNLMFDALFHLDKAATALSNQVCKHPFFIRKAPVTPFVSPWGQTITNEQPRSEASSSSASSTSRPTVVSSSSSSSSSSRGRATSQWDVKHPSQKNVRSVVHKVKRNPDSRSLSEERLPKKRSRSRERDDGRSKKNSGSLERSSKRSKSKEGSK